MFRLRSAYRACSRGEGRSPSSFSYSYSPGDERGGSWVPRVASPFPPVPAVVADAEPVLLKLDLTLPSPALTLHAAVAAVRRLASVAPGLPSLLLSSTPDSLP